MNPEFQRNLWLEAGSRRLAWTGVVLAAIYGAVALVAREHALSALGMAGGAVFVIAVLIWGVRAAGGALADEVRQRTWDFQRLSALTPWQMTWGKLFGATVLAWIAGASGLVLAVIGAAAEGRLDTAAPLLIAALGLGVTMQAGALVAAVVNLRRARAEGRTPSFRFTAGGVIGLLVVFSAARQAFPTRGLGLGGPLGWIGGSQGEVDWWGLTLPNTWFLALSLAAFAAWSLTAAWRLMRLELEMENGPWLWPAFVAFAGFWAAGLVDGGLTLRFAVAGAAFAACAYVGAFAEPADRVRLRLFGGALRRRDWAAVKPTIPLVAAPVALSLLAVAGVAVLPFAGEGDEPSALLALAALAFLARDLAVVAYFRLGPRPGRGDFGAALGLFLAYFVGGVVGFSLGPGGAALFAPSLAAPLISLLSAAVQAAVLWRLAWTRVRAPGRSEA